MQANRITAISWGEMTIHGLGAGKDWKLWPDGGRHWDWEETGTMHSPGILIDDVTEILDKKIQKLILSRGMHLRLETSPDTIAFLEKSSIEYFQLETKEAAEQYNQFIDAGFRVGGLFHSTC